jgi:DNA-binding protein YbaB
LGGGVFFDRSGRYGSVPYCNESGTFGESIAGRSLSMAREIDESWVEEAIERYRRIEALQADFDRAVGRIEVAVRSPDGLVEVVVTAAGVITDVRIQGAAGARTNVEVSRSVRAAVAAAADAARWAREKLHVETFGEYRPLTEE